jgi:hypothetical protein
MRWIVGLLLVSAAILKATQLIVEPTVAVATGRLLPPLQVGVELAVGLFAMSGWYWRQLRWIALLLFIAFAGYSFHLATSGATSCGCFGPLRVHPWWTFALDIAVVLGLSIAILRSGWVRRGGDRAAHESSAGGAPAKSLTSLQQSEEDRWWGGELGRRAAHRRIVVAAATAVSIITTALLVRYVNQQTAAAEGMLTMAGRLIVLEPEDWVGKALPIAKFVDLDLSQGEWTVLLHRDDCPDCHEAVPKYEQLASSGVRVALVEVPPFGEFHPASGACHYCRLSDEREWFVQTPVEIKLRDGIVISATTGSEIANSH